MQTILWLGHSLIYATALAFFAVPERVAHDLGIVLFLLSISFTISAVLGFRFANAMVASLYKFAVIWLGILNFFTWAALLCWAVDSPLILTGTDTPGTRHVIAAVLFGLAGLVSLGGFVNARILRQRRITVSLPNLPESWRGKTALLVTDIHLGHVNAAGFARRIVKIAKQLDPRVILIAGDLYDGSKADPVKIAKPLFHLEAPLGVYFTAGNHEEYGDVVAYLNTLERGGFRILHNERVDLDGLQLIGISYVDSTRPARVRTFLERLRLPDGGPSILMNHVPHHLSVAEQAGVNLQVSGHTHGGQVFPFTWITRRMFRQYTYGLNPYGNMQVLTSSGVGTWGPPMRVGTSPEVVLITFA